MLKKLSKLLGIGLTIALLTSLLAVAAPAAALTQPTVTFASGDNIISKANPTITVQFTVNQQLSENDTINLVFPTETTVGTLTGTIVAGGGLFNGAYLPAGVINATANWTVGLDGKTAVRTLGIGDQIPQGAQIWITITAGITNPDAVGDYTLSVYTSKETTPVTSTTYSIIAPIVGPLPGIVKLYNPSGILMASYVGATGIQQAIDDAQSTAGSTIEVGAGTYIDDPNVTKGGLTIKNAADAATADVIVKGTWDVSAAGSLVYPNTTITGLTLMPNANNMPVIKTTGSANNTVVSNCVISKLAVPFGQLPNPVMISLAKGTVTITGCTIDSTDGTVNDNVIVVADGPVTVSANTFNLDSNATGTDDVAVSVTSGSKVTISDNAFTGASGIGYKNTAAAASTVTITNNTFTGLAKAIFDSNGTTGSKLTVQDNMIMDSTVLPNVNANTATAAIDLTNVYQAILEQNTIKDSNGYAVMIGAAANVSGITFIGNELSGNAFGTVNKKVNSTLTAELNYWGDASGPTISSNPGGIGDPIVASSTTAGSVDYSPWINTTVSQVAAGLSVPINGTADKSTTVGISYTSTAATAGISLMKYTGNPAPVDTPAPALDGGFFDVYSPAAGGTTTVLFFNPNITPDTKAYYYSALQKEWVICSTQAVAGNGAYVYVTITGTSNPSNTELNGTIFALISQKTIPNPPAINTPSIGEANVSIEPMFTWSAVQGAVRYELSVADDPSFTFLVFSHNVEGITFYKASASNEEALDYDTTYYWRVRAILDDSFSATTPATAYTTGIFTTMAEPTTDGGPTIEVNPTTPEVTVDIPPTQITVEPAGSAIPTYILWIIVVVGAILVIALIVLIVRTRRVA